MITLRKLATLPRKTALRKAAALLQGFELDLRSGKNIEARYLEGLWKIICEGGEVESLLPAPDRVQIDMNDPEAVLRTCNYLRHLLLQYLGVEPADWDLMDRHAGPGSQALQNTAVVGGSRTVLPIKVFLEDIRSPFNVGSIFRSSESFGVSEIMLTPPCPDPTHKRAKRSAMGCGEIVPWKVGGLFDIPSDDEVFVLELGGTDLRDFAFPDRGTVIVGNEELGASPEARRRADESAGRVSIPLYGTKGSLNVSAAFAILIHTWCSRIIQAIPGLNRSP